jgi:hypothetical protein
MTPIAISLPSRALSADKTRENYDEDASLLSDKKKKKKIIL